MNLVWSSSVWVLLGLCGVLLAWWIWRTVAAMRMIARRPAVSVEALNLHDASVGSVARALALISYLIISLVPSIWWPYWSQDGAWPLGMTGVVTAVGLIVMELRWPAPGGTVRSAGLRPRSVRDILPRAGTTIAGLGLLLGAGAIIVCGWITGQARPGGGQDTPAGDAFAWPWPGWWQTAPYSIGMALVVAVVVGAALVLVRRPSLAGMSSAIDIAYRRAAMDRVLRVVAAVGFLVAAMVANWLKNYALVALGHSDAATSVRDVFAWQSVALVFVALVSIDMFRTKLPKTAPSSPLAHAESSLP